MTKKPSAYPIIGGVLFAVAALLALIIGLSSIYSTAAILFALCLAAGAVFLFMRKRDLLGVIGMFAVAAGVLFYVALSLIAVSRLRYFIFSGFEFICQFFAICGAAAAGVLALAEFLNIIPALRGFAKKFWFIPGAVIGVFMLFVFFKNWDVLSTLIYLLVSAGVLMECLWIAYPETVEDPEERVVTNGDFGDCYISLIKHTVLLFVTFGVWQYIWTFRTTKKLNRVEGLPYRSPVKKLLLCIFVPMYALFWTYRTGRIVDKAAAQKGLPTDMSVIATLLGVFMAPIAYIVLQDRINELAQA